MSAGFWDGIAEQYAAKPVDDPEAFERKIAVTRSLMDPTDVVLDIGCGTGSLALILAQDAAEVHGLDISPEMHRIANSKRDAQGAANVVFHCGPFDDSFDAFPDGSLDGICAYSILHLVPDRTDALARIHRLLKPGGFFISSTACLGGGWIPYRPLLAVMHWLGKAPLVSVFDQDTLVREVRDAGFVDIELPDVGADATITFMTARKQD